MNYIIYDLEATCWKSWIHRDEMEIIEIGALKLDEYGTINDDFSSFVKPVIHPYLSPFCVELTGIKQEDVENAGTFEKVIERFQDWVGVGEEEYILCAWGSFDAEMLVNNCRIHKIDEDWVEPVLNLKQEYREMKKLNGKVGLKKAIRVEGFEFTGEHHRAMSDANNLAKIFVKYLDVWAI